MDVLSKEAAYRKLQRMAHEILERNSDEKKIILAGVKQNGIIIARIISGFLKPIFPGEVEIIEIDINKKNPQEVSLSGNVHPLSLDNQVIILTDDVSNSGRTLSYSLKPFLNYYPAKIQTLVLVERSHKRFPVTPDYMGLSIATALSEKIIVETNGEEITGAVILNEIE